MFRLELFAKRDGYPQHKLPLIIHSFVSDSAEKWLWVYTRDNPNATWQEMRVALLFRFSSHETERETRRVIERRMQKHKESFNDFSLEIQTLNGRLTQNFSESEMLEILRENMHPALPTMTIQKHFESIDHLRNVCQKYERLWANSGFDFRNNAEPMSRRQNISEIKLESDLTDDYNITSLKMNETDDTQNVSALHGTDSKRTEYLICWNCKDLGHRYQDCVKDFTEIFCFGCGRTGVRKPNCEHCLKFSKSNYTPNVLRPGVTRSVVNQSSPRR